MRLFPHFDSPPGAPSDHSIQFILKEVDGLVEVIRLDGYDHGASLDFYMPFGAEIVFVGFPLGETQFDPKSLDMSFVFKQLLHFLGYDSFQGRGEVEVVAGDNDIVTQIFHNFYFFPFLLFVIFALDRRIRKIPS